MADFTQTISNSLNVFGLEGSTLWGAATWGTDLWGQGSTTALNIDKPLTSETLTLTEDLQTEVVYNAILENSISIALDLTDETLQDSAGYYYVFTKPTTDADDRSLATYTEASSPTTTWTEGSTSGPTWSEQ